MIAPALNLSTRRRPSVPVVVLCVTLLGLGGLAVVHHQQISALQDMLQSDRQALAIDGLNEHMALLDSEMETLTHSREALLSRTDFATAQESLQRQLLEVRKQVAGLQNREDDPEAVALKAQVESIQTTLNTLSQRLESVAARNTPPSARPALPQKRSVKPKPVPTLTPPFDTVGIEVRGGERYLSVAPSGSTRLDQLVLIRPGDTLQAWHLERLGPTTAEFRVNGNPQIVFIR